MYTYDQTNIKNNIIYFPLWRIKYTKYAPWTWEERFNILNTLQHEGAWTHNCLKLGTTMYQSTTINCPYCGANKLNEPSEDAIHDYMELNYD